MITMLCFLAVSCINFVVGPSGIFSTASYQRVCCSAQKYGVVKTSCIQRICTPCAAASSINFKCFSTFWRLISSIEASVGAAFVACMSPHLTVRGIKYLRVSLTASTWFGFFDRAGNILTDLLPTVRYLRHLSFVNDVSLEIAAPRTYQ